MIRVWLGPLPEWTPRWLQHVAGLSKYGWDFVLLNDTADFVRRCERVFGFSVDPQPGTRKPCEYDPALGELYADLIQGYNFWGQCNLDCLYGRIDRWLTDEYLSGCDIFGNDPGAICGPLSVYRNTPKVNSLYRSVPNWREIFQSNAFHGFDEGEFNAQVRISPQIRFRSAFWQAHDCQERHNPTPKIKLLEDGTLWDAAANEETLMFHFHRFRKWPILES